MLYSKGQQLRRQREEQDEIRKQIQELPGYVDDARNFMNSKMHPIILGIQS